MLDIIRGLVTRVVDGDTFDIAVTRVGKNNKYQYDNNTRIRIVDIDAPELSTPAGKLSKNNLESKLNGKEVQCQVQTRDTYNRVVAKIDVL